MERNFIGSVTIDFRNPENYGFMTIISVMFMSPFTVLNSRNVRDAHKLHNVINTKKYHVFAPMGKFRYLFPILTLRVY